MGLHHQYGTSLEQTRISRHGYSEEIETMMQLATNRAHGHRVPAGRAQMDCLLRDEPRIEIHDMRMHER